MGKFIINKSISNEYQFNLLNSNEQVILTSEGFTSKDNCIAGIRSVKNNATFDSRYERKIANNGEFYFNLKGGNELIIGTSEMYTSIYQRENGIGSVKKYVLEADIVDETI